MRRDVLGVILDLNGTTGTAGAFSRQLVSMAGRRASPARRGPPEAGERCGGVASRHVNHAEIGQEGFALRLQGEGFLLCAAV